MSVWGVSPSVTGFPAELSHCALVFLMLRKLLFKQLKYFHITKAMYTPTPTHHSHQNNSKMMEQPLPPPYQ